MNWFIFFGWFVFGVIALGTVSTVLIVGQDRKPLTPGIAAVSARDESRQILRSCSAPKPKLQKP